MRRDGSFGGTALHHYLSARHAVVPLALQARRDVGTLRDALPAFPFTLFDNQIAMPDDVLFSPVACDILPARAFCTRTCALRL